MAENPDLDRKKDYSGRERVRETLFKIYNAAFEAFTRNTDRINDILDYWDMYECKLGPRQAYTGRSKAFVPLVRNAVEARVTRFTNQVFPASGRYIDVSTSDDSQPNHLMSLVSHYVQRARLRTLVVPTLFRNGDIEGQYNVYVDWRTRKRHTLTREQKGVGVSLAGQEVEVETDEPIEDVKEETVTDFGPWVECLSDNDVVMLPAIAASADEAVTMYGGSVTILRRWTKRMIKDYIAEGVFTRKAGETLLARLEEGPSEEPGKKDTAKAHLDAAGVKAKGKYVLGYETWTQLDLGDGEQRVCVAYFGGDDLILGCRRNPYWCDLLPIISAPVTRQSGSGKGVPLASYVDTMQYQANDYMNLGADSATYALLPIAMTDPVKNPFYSQMVATMGAVWPTAPNDTKIVEFPPLYQHALTLIAAVKAEIYETMSVNPSMIAQRPAGKKPTQAEIAAEQQIDILTVADVVGPAEESILTPIVERFVAYDAQFRTDEISVKAFGPEAVKASMEQVPPQQLGTKAVFTWYGVEQARNQQTMQLQMAGMNVLRNLPPQAIPGKRLNFVPLIEKFVENVFGPRMASKIFLDDVGEPPELENQFLAQFDLPVSPSDNDMQHMQVHQAALGGGDPHGFIRGHIHKHQLQMAARNQAAAQAQQGGQPGQPGQARPGSMSTGPRQQGPAGMIHKDAIPLAQPRRAG